MSKSITDFIPELRRLPLDRSTNNDDFLQYIQKLIREYVLNLKDVEKIEVEGKSDYMGKPIINQVIDTASNLNGTIIKTLEKYWDGSPSDAYNEFSNGLTNVFKPNTNFSVIEKNNLFRIRVGNQGETIQSKGILHIPMNEREKVASRRFSISGLPCLYLSSSLFLCWLELNRPEITRCHAAFFKTIPNSEPLLVIDLTNIHPELINTSKGKSPKWDGKLIRFLSLWPLIAACSVKVKFPSTPFKPEYIIPQLLLQYIRKQKANFHIAGVKYSSTHYNYYSSLNKLSIDDFNIALPIKSSTPNQYCDFITNTFALTRPISWEYFNILNANYNLSTVEHDGKMVEIYTGEASEYSHTAFGIMESYLTTKRERIKINCNGEEIKINKGFR